MRILKIRRLVWVIGFLGFARSLRLCSYSFYFFLFFYFMIRMMCKSRFMICDLSLGVQICDVYF